MNFNVSGWTKYYLYYVPEATEEHQQSKFPKIIQPQLVNDRDRIQIRSSGPRASSLKYYTVYPDNLKYRKIRTFCCCCYYENQNNESFEETSDQELKILKIDKRLKYFYVSGNKEVIGEIIKLGNWEWEGRHFDLNESSW